MQQFKKGEAIQFNLGNSDWMDATYVRPATHFIGQHYIEKMGMPRVVEDYRIRPTPRPTMPVLADVSRPATWHSEQYQVAEPCDNASEIHTNQHGGKQSALPYRCDLFPPSAMLKLAEVLASGATKYGDRNWRLITVNEHLNHASTHILKHHTGDTSEHHLSHAACRLMMALEISLVGMDKEEMK